MLFCLDNLVSSAITRAKPWEWLGKPPEFACKDKKARDHWINTPATRWNVYSAVEGLNENGRLSGRDDGNPPYKLHGFIADYDYPTTESFLREALKAFPYQPQYIERTLSGNLRLIWLFEKPAPVASGPFLTFFLEQVLASFPADKLLPAFDAGAWKNFTRYYTNSGEWLAANPDAPRIPHTRVLGWQVEAAGKFNWVKNGGVEIPFPILAQALGEKYPRFSQWEDFSLRSQGPSFWVDGSVSPKSAIVHETGIQTFADHAAKPFYSWEDLLGPSFVSDYKADSIGAAVEGIHFDDKAYWRFFGVSGWRPRDKHDTREFLRVVRGLTVKCDKKTGVSDLDRSMEFIRDHQLVTCVGKYIYRPSGIIEIGGQRVLNISTVKTVQPAEKIQSAGSWSEWGISFPFLARFLEHVFSSEEQLPVWCDWQSIFYTAAYRMEPVSGLNVFIAGPAAIGKTFLNLRIIGGLMGGTAQAADYLLGNDVFGAELFSMGHWAVDDAIFALSPVARQRFGEAVKKMNANPFHRYHEKFRQASVVEWRGRIVITCNDDPESVRAIPDLSGNILDKIHIFRTTNIKFEWPSQDEVNRTLVRELPHLGRWLLDHYDKCYKSTDRFGQTPYHEPTIVTGSERSGYNWTFHEILTHYLEGYFATHTDTPSWQGTAYELHKAISGDETARAAMRSYDVAAVSRQLASLMNKGHRVQMREMPKKRLWTIFRQDK